MFAELFAGKLSARAGSVFSLAFFFLLAMNAPMFLFNDGRFQLKDMISGVVAEGFVIIMALLPFFKTMKGAYSDGKTYEQTVAVGYLRWAQALGAEGEQHLEEGEGKKAPSVSAADSLLFRHDKNDDNCTCALKECSGNLPVRAGQLLVAEKATRTFAPLYCDFTAVCYTSVITFGYSTWSIWYWALIGAAMYLMGFLVFFSMGTGFRTASAPLLELNHRLQLRTVKTTLKRLYNSLLGDLAAASLDSVSVDTTVDRDRSAESNEAMKLFIMLQTQLMADWRSRMSFLSGGKAGLLYIQGLEVVALILNVATGGCLVQWPLTSTIYLSLILLGSDLLNIAAANKKMDEVAAVFLSTRKRVREVVSLAGTESTSSSTPQRASREFVVGVCRDKSGARYLLGFTVSYGFL